VAGTFAYTPPASTVLGAGSNRALSVTFTPTDTIDYNTVNGSTTITVSKSVPSITAWPTASAIAVGQALAISTLSNGTATPGGTFAWTDSSIVPSQGTTVYSVTFTPTDAVDYTTVAGPVSVTVTPAATTQDFTINASGTTSQMVIPGGAVAYRFSIAPLSGSYAGTVTFSASGLPVGASARFSPSTISVTGGAQTVTMTVQTAPLTAIMEELLNARRLAPLALAMAFLPLFGEKKLRLQGRRMRRWLCLLVLLGGMVASTALTSCGGVYFTQTLKNYTVTVTATSGSIQHSFPVALKVR
jgi:hypothetical protein